CSPVTVSDDRLPGFPTRRASDLAAFSDKNVGSGKTVSVSGITLSGADAGNHTFNSTASTTASISALALTIRATGVDKVYDGSSSATVTLSDDRIAGDDLSETYGSAAFSDKNVGSGKTVS